MSTAITTTQQAAPMEFTPEQLKLIRDSFLSGASEQEAAVLLELARLRRLNPITRQIHFVKRWDHDKGGWVWSAQVGIDGFRSIAERTGRYDGQDEPEFAYDGKRLVCAKVRVYRKDWGRPSVGVAHFDEYAQKKKDGNCTKMWAEKPHVMLAKCAEALAFRKAFPEDTSGLYTPEEMGYEENQREAQQARQQSPSRVTVDAPPGYVATPPPPTLPEDTGTLRVPSQAVSREAQQEAVQRVQRHLGGEVQKKERTPGEDDGPTYLSFGPWRGSSIPSLTESELSAAVDMANAKLQESPKAKWVPSVQLQLAALMAEVELRQKAPAAPF